INGLRTRQTQPKDTHQEIGAKLLALFALIYRYVDDPAIVSKHRPAHRKYLQDLADEGELIAAGPIGEPGPTGGLLVIRAEYVDRVKKIIGVDPSNIHGV